MNHPPGQAETTPWCEVPVAPPDHTPGTTPGVTREGRALKGHTHAMNVNIPVAPRAPTTAPLHPTPRRRVRPVRHVFSTTLLLTAAAACARMPAQAGQVAPKPPAIVSDPLKFGIVAPEAGLPEVRIVAHEFAFDPMVLSVPANRPFTLVLDNTEGVVEHDVDVPALGGLHIHAMPRSEARSTIVITASAGNYVFACTLPGHRAAGMRGTIVVTAG